jgi:hypothetical protein
MSGWVLTEAARPKYIDPKQGHIVITFKWLDEKRLWLHPVSGGRGQKAFSE